MNLPRLRLSWPALAVAAVAVAAFSAAAHAQVKPGVYGRVPPRDAHALKVIYEQPLVVHRAMVAADARPSYLYVPPGQVRKWAQHCHKWQACAEPVLFVRVDDSPSRWGAWKQWRTDAPALAAAD